jgi:hypothetical protein
LGDAASGERTRLAPEFYRSFNLFGLTLGLDPGGLRRKRRSRHHGKAVRQHFGGLNGTAGDDRRRSPRIWFADRRQFPWIPGSFRKT